MDRAEQLKKLSREHHTTLVLTRSIAKIAENGNEEELKEAIEKVKAYNDEELEVHFQHEERTIFAPFFKEYQEHLPLAKALLKEHGFIRMLIPSMTVETAKQDLAAFSEVLKNHTRVEERDLFPLIEKLFSDEQLDAVLNFKPLD